MDALWPPHDCHMQLLIVNPNQTQMKRRVLLLLMSCSLVGILHAQTPTDAIMMKQRQFCFAAVYDRGSWDHYWEGTHLRTHGAVKTVTRQTITPMLAVGIHDKLNLLIGLPYVKTGSSEPNGGYLQGVDGFQDIGVSLKGQVLQTEIGTHKFQFLVNAGFSTPATNYLSDYMPYSLGLGAPEASLRGIAQFKMSNGFYVMAAGAHLWRGMTEVERDYYYNNGSYYTNKMDVPNAWHVIGAIGCYLLDNDLRLEANYVSLNSTSGDDVRKYNPGQPTNKIEYGQAGFFAQYIPETLKGVGVLAYYSQVLSGRNFGKSTNIGVGLTYQFQL